MEKFQNLSDSPRLFRAKSREFVELLFHWWLHTVRAAMMRSENGGASSAMSWRLAVTTSGGIVAGDRPESRP